MSDAMFSIDLDVSRALAAQQAMLRGFDEVAKAGNRITTGLDGASGEFSKIENSIKGVGNALGKISSSTNLHSELASLQKINRELDKLRHMNELGLGNIPEGAFKKVLTDAVELNGVLRTMDKVVNALASQLKALPSHKFDFSSVEEYRNKLNNLGNELNALKAFKASLDPIDYSKMKASLETAINTTKQQFRDFTGSQDPYGMIAAFDRTFNTIAAKSQTLVKDSLAVTKRFITGNEVADSMGLNYKGGLDTLTRNITEATNKAEAEAKRLNQVLKTSFVGQGTPSNTQAQLLASATQYYNSISFGGGKISHGDIAKSMGFGDDLVGKATAALPIVNQLAAHIDTVGKKAAESQSKLSGLGLVIKRVFEYGLVYRFQNALMSLPGAFYDMNMSMEKFAATYRGIFGEQAASKMEFVKGAANAYGLDIISLADSYKKFGVTLNELGVAGSTTDRIFESFTEGLKKAGASSADSENAFRALIQMYSKGVVSAEEFTRQLSQYIPAANAMAARSLGVTTGEFKKMMAAGQIIPEQFIPEFTKQMKIFGIGWEESAKTMESSVTRMSNAAKEFVDSKPFQKMATSTIDAGTSMIKFTDNFINGLNMVKNGDMSITTLLFGKPGEVEKDVAEFNKKMANLDAKIEYTKNKLATMPAPMTSIIPSPSKLIFGDPYEKEYNATKNELADAEKQKWAQQLQTVLKDASQEYVALQRKFNEGDLSVKASLEYDREKIEWAEYHLKEIGKMNGQSVLMTLDVETSGIQNAIALVNRLWSTTREGKLEETRTKYENVTKAAAEFKNEIDSINSATEDKTERMRMLPILEKNLAKANVEAKELKENLYSAAATAAGKNMDFMDKALAKAIPGKSNIAAKVAAASKAAQDEIDKYVGTAEKAGVDKNSTKYIAGLKHLQDVKKAAEIEAAKPDKSGGGHKEERHANAVDKLTTSLDNLLRKEMGLADEKPLAAAFAAADEKLNSLMRNIKNLALDGGFSIEEATNKAQAMHKELLKIAADKQLENLFPWLKKDDALKATADIIEQFFHGTEEQSKAVAKSLDDAGMSIWDVFERMKKLTELAPGVRALAEAQRKLSEASSFGEYADAVKQVDTIENSPGNKGEMEAIKEFYDTYIILTKGMTESRLEMYRRVAEQAKANGMDEAQAAAYVQSKWQEAEVQRLEAVQKYGSASEAFSARMAQNFEMYKDGATKSRESAVQMADSIKGMADTVSSGIGQAFGDMIRNIGNGNAKIEDMWKNMLARMLDALASFVEEAITKWTKDLIRNLFSNGKSSDPISSTISSISNMRDGGTGSSSGLGNILNFGKTIGKGIIGSFSSGESDASSFIKQLSEARAVEKTVQAASPSGYTAFTSGASQAGALATRTTSATSKLGSIGSVLGVVGAIGGLAGLAFSLFGDQGKKKKEPAKPLYDGTISAYSGGAAMVAPMTVMDDGTMKTKTINPQDIQKTQEAFKELVDSIKDAAKVLKIDLVENFSNSFNFITGVVSDELAESVSWAVEDNLGKQALGGLSEAVMFFSDGMQNVTEVFTELAEATGTVKGSIEALGIDFTKFAAIDDKYIETIANFAVKGTGDLSNAFGSVSQSAMSAAEYISQYSDELRILAEAQMAKLYQDALGGEDQFNSAMQTYAQYGITTKRQKESALSYYTSELSSLLGDFQDKFSSVFSDFSGAGIDVNNIESFWSAYNAAMQQSMSPKMLAAWAEMASYAKMISDTADELEAVNAAANKWDADIKYRKQMAAGLEEEAALTKQLSEYEQELVQARTNSMTYTQQAALVEAQIAELQKKYNDITGVTVDATSSYSAALEQLSDTLQNTIDVLSDVSSTAESLASAWEGIASSLDSAMDSMRDDVIIDYTSVISSRMEQLDAAYIKGMAGDSDSMADVAEYATSAWEAVKKGSVTPEQYDTAYWTIQNRLANAKAASSGMSEYESTIANLTKSLVDIAQEISDELQDDDKDAAYLEQSNILYGYVEDFQKYVDLYKAGRITDEAFASSVQSISSNITGWISKFVGDYATISADQVRALTTEADFIRGAIADGSTLTAEQLSALYKSNDQIGAATVEAVLGNSVFLKELMGGNIELSGLSEQQASILSSALSAMETVGKYTGTNLTYSDMANYYLAKISDGVTVSGWADLITTITTGEENLANSITTAINNLQATLKDLLEKASSQSDTSTSQSNYFASKQQLLYKQTQIELYTSQLEQARSTAAGYQNYAAMALMSGGTMGTIVGMQWLQKYNDMQSEIAKLQEQLDYWTSYTPTAMATGGIVTGPTLAYIGEGGESEAVIPLSQLNTMVSGGSDSETKRLLSELVVEMRTNTQMTKLVAERVYDRDKNKTSALYR